MGRSALLITTPATFGGEGETRDAPVRGSRIVRVCPKAKGGLTIKTRRKPRTTRQHDVDSGTCPRRNPPRAQRLPGCAAQFAAVKRPLAETREHHFLRGKAPRCRRLVHSITLGPHIRE
jgi:hypothetical protein